jgi:hypothetical protein
MDLVKIRRALENGKTTFTRQDVWQLLEYAESLEQRLALADEKWEWVEVDGIMTRQLRLKMPSDMMDGSISPYSTESKPARCKIPVRKGYSDFHVDHP